MHPTISRTAIATSVMLISACATSNIGEPTVQRVGSDFETCLTKAMDMMVGTWEYTSVIEGFLGGYVTWSTRTIHDAPIDGMYVSRSFGGDMSEEDENSNEYERIIGNQIVRIENGVAQTENARTFTSCSDPDGVGRIKTTSTYETSFDVPGAENLTVDNYSSFSEGGTFFIEEMRNVDGDIVARVSGVTTPVDSNRD